MLTVRTWRSTMTTNSTRVSTVIVGAGQSGLATGYWLKQRGETFVILDRDRQVGDVWRRRWDSLRLFTPARYSALPGMASALPPVLTPARTSSPTTWRTTRHASTCRCDRESVSIRWARSTAASPSAPAREP
ncbi:NAD(P)-binding protein [Paraoerskovia sediminicola]|uniref:NAD(P)-binding protein n=1 Tax=Paraoerskovia sediminicola TaxID=1138587 RepID=UPI0033067B75